MSSIRNRVWLYAALVMESAIRETVASIPGPDAMIFDDGSEMIFDDSQRMEF